MPSASIFAPSFAGSSWSAYRLLVLCSPPLNGALSARFASARESTKYVGCSVPSTLAQRTAEPKQRRFDCSRVPGGSREWVVGGGTRVPHTGHTICRYKTNHHISRPITVPHTVGLWCGPWLLCSSHGPGACIDEGEMQCRGVETRLVVKSVSHPRTGTNTRFVVADLPGSQRQNQTSPGGIAEAKDKGTLSVAICVTKKK